MYTIFMHTFIQYLIRLVTGTTLAVLNVDRKMPEAKERLHKSATCLEISSYKVIGIWGGTLSEKEALLTLIDDIRRYWIKDDVDYFMLLSWSN